MENGSNIFSEELAFKIKALPTARIGLFGGSFDPVHNAHIQCALCAARGLRLDALIMMPSYINPFKLSVASGVADADERVRMCELAVEEMHQAYCATRKTDATLGECLFEVSTWEVAQGAKGNTQASFTVDTLRAVRAALPEEAQVYYILGSDSAKELPSWHDAKELASLATFCVVKRPGSPWSINDDKLLCRTGFSIQVIEGPESNVYSTDVRAALLKGADVSKDMPKSIVDYIAERGLYSSSECVRGEADVPSGLGSAGAYFERTPAISASENGTCAQMLADMPSVEAHMAGQAQPEKLPQVMELADLCVRKPSLPDDDVLIDMLRERVNEHRFTHIMGVAQTARLLAQVYGIDQDKAYTAGLLHDWDKCFTDDEIRQRANELGIDVEPLVLSDMPQTLHGLTAAAYFEQNYMVDSDIIQAVARHTTGAPDMTPLDMCLYIADALEPHRLMDGIDDLRGLIGKANLQDLFFEVYGYWMCLVIQRKRTVHPDSLIVWNTYALRYAQSRGLKFDAIAKSV